MDFMSDGRARTRDQKLAVVVPESMDWEQAIKHYFAERLQLSPELQDKALYTQSNWFKEENQLSPSIPGMFTTYLTHEVRIRIVEGQQHMLQAIGLPGLTNFCTLDPDKERTSSWRWVADDAEMDQPDLLRHLLQDHHIRVDDFEPGAFNDLIDELYETRIADLRVRGKQLMRHLQIIKVWFTADIFTVPMVLVTTSKLQRGKRSKVSNKPVSMRMRIDEHWKEGLCLALTQKLGLDTAFQERHIMVDMSSYRLSEETEFSKSFPGLKTVYRIHEVTCSCHDVASIAHRVLGLPEGSDCSISRVQDNNALIVTDFTWKPQAELWDKSALNKDVVELEPKRRLPAPQPLLTPRKRTTSCFPHPVNVNPFVQELMSACKTDWHRAQNAARRIRDEDYTCQQFFADCIAAFPELALYLGTDDTGKSTATSSGRSGDDEYQRTMGALFAVYWLLRVDMDGAQSFAFGVGNDWRPLNASSSASVRSCEEIDRRDNFLKSMKWDLFSDMFVSAGLLQRVPGEEQFLHDEGRVLAMLVLTAIHDIMKIEDLLPVVDAKHERYGDYKAGDQIGDHDMALGYILEHYPTALPSFAGLEKVHQDSIRFTQGKMEYNMGWLVQAEAPPGPLFRKFRSVICSGGASKSDIAFYFAHWLTDLAGAEPFPQEGCEKFVLKFPSKVLTMFLNSFQFVEALESKTETQVYEEYLEWRWVNRDPMRDPMPEGSGSVALMRLGVMTQGSEKVLAAYDDLHEDDREVLSVELARTGLHDQRYQRDVVPSSGGPAFLVYYGPALLCKNSSSDALGVLRVLAEVLRQARVLWPLEEQLQDKTVTLRVDSLKELDVEKIRNTEPNTYWVLQQMSSVDGFVTKVSLLEAANMSKKQGTKRQQPLYFHDQLAFGH